MRNPTLLTGLGIGALGMYLMDPDRGRRRRARLRDKLISTRYAVGDAVDMTTRDVANRARGTVASIRSRLTRDDATDDVIAERVRTALGGVAGHARSIDVSVANGRATVRGPILAREGKRVLRRVASVRGVRGVVDQLDRREVAGRESGLQGEPATPRAGERMEWMQAHWSPSARLVAGAAGVVMALHGVTRTGALSVATTAGGVALLLRAATNEDLRRLFGIGAGPGAVVVRKGIEIVAPVEEVFAVWTRYEDFPRFMSRVREVRRLPDNRSRWTVSGPAGVPIEWETVETERRPNEIIGWRTDPRPGDTVAHAGLVRFERTLRGTRIDVEMSYTPIGGALGHRVAALLGADPKRAIDDDLVRFKSLLEDGKTNARTETVRREEIA